MDEIITFDLFGDKFRFKPDNNVSDPEKVAEYLNDYISKSETLVKDKTSERNKIAILLLAAMNLAKDFHELKTRHSELEKEINYRVSSIVNRIDKEIENNKSYELL